MSEQQDPQSWEVLTGIQVLQATQSVDKYTLNLGDVNASNELEALCAAGKVGSRRLREAFNWDAAFREAQTTGISYLSALSKNCLVRIPGIKYTVAKLTRFDNPVRAPGIVVCPFPCTTAQFLPAGVWVHIIRLMRSYGLPVYYMGDADTRMDVGLFSEGEVLANLPVKEKLAILADAHLVIGQPNAWTHAALSYRTNVIVNFSDQVAETQWFPAWEHRFENNYARIGYSPTQFNLASFLSALRLVVEKMDSRQDQPIRSIII